jgi:hypothetical protein
MSQSIIDFCRSMKILNAFQVDHSLSEYSIAENVVGLFI